jgi:hypothetical protein
MRPALRNVSRWVCRLHEQAGVDRGDRLAVWCLANDMAAARAASDALANAPGVLGRLLAERLTNASPLPWLQADQDHGIDGNWLLCAALDERHAPADAALHVRLPVG